MLPKQKATAKKRTEEKMEKLYNIYYGENENDYIKRYLKEEDILDGYLSEAKAFEIFFSDMIMCNNYLQQNHEALDELVSGYDEEEDYYADEYQIFIVNIEYDEETTIKVVKKMGNTLYYDNNLDLYITGITDFGTSRRIVPTDLIVKAVK